MEIPDNFELWETDAAYYRRGREGRGPFELDRCFVCDRPVESGANCIGMRIDNPSGKLQLIAGPGECRSDGSHFPIHVGVTCLQKALRAWRKGVILNK
jgi:hypothetical protein